MGLWVCPQLCRGIFKWGGVSPEVYGQFACLPGSDNWRHFPSVLLSAYFPFLSFPWPVRSLFRERKWSLQLHLKWPGRTTPTTFTSSSSARKIMLAHRWMAGSPPSRSLPTLLALQPPWGPIYSV